MEPQVKKANWNSFCNINVTQNQVAAGVVKRMLPRPVNGMPKEWRRVKVIPSLTSVFVQKGNIILKQITDKLKNGTKIMRKYNNKYVVAAVPGIVLVGIALYDKNKVMEVTGSTVSEVKRLPHLISAFAQRIIKTKNTSDRKSEEMERVDFEAFQRVQHQSLWDKLVLRVNRLVGHKHER